MRLSGLAITALVKIKCLTLDFFACFNVTRLIEIASKVCNEYGVYE